MGTISGNLGAMAKEIDVAKKKSDKLRDKGAKAQASKVASAVADVESATMQWESQAPYVFEKLQAVDESRINHLRDALTQFQTHEVDQVERNRVTAEETLNALLNIETADEIKTFALKLQRGETPIPSRKQSTVSSPPRNLAPPPPVPAIPHDDDRSQGSGALLISRFANTANMNQVHEVKHSGGLHGLKRFGTVLSRRKSSHPYGRASSPDRKSSTNLSSAFSGFGKSKNKDRDAPSPSPRPGSPLRRLSTSRASEASNSPRQPRTANSDKPNGTLSPEPTAEPASSSGAVNGTAPETIPELKEPLSPPPPAEAKPEVINGPCFCRVNSANS
jgi:hypothetical protein